MQAKKTVLNTLFAIFVIVTVASAFMSWISIEYEYQEVIKQPGFSGSDLLGSGIAHVAVTVILITAIGIEYEIYFNMKYFFLKTPSEKTILSTVINIVCCVGALLWPLVWFGTDEVFWIFGVGWMAVYLILRIIYFIAWRRGK